MEPNLFLAKETIAKKNSTIDKNLQARGSDSISKQVRIQVERELLIILQNGKLGGATLMKRKKMKDVFIMG